MPQALFPDARFRSPTAVQNRSDVRDEMVYSALYLGDQAVGQTKTFTIPQGQTIPALGSTAPRVAGYQATYSNLTTNLTKAGEFGSALGDASVRGIGITIECAQPQVTAAFTSLYSAQGATPVDVAAILAQCSFALRIGGKKQIEQPVWAFPALGGPKGVITVGSVGSATTGVSGGFLTNGEPGTGRKLKIPILIARTDTVEGEFSITSTLDFAGSNAQGVLVWTGLLALVKGDVR